MRTLLRLALALSGIALFSLPTNVRAADQWTPVHEGISYLRRTAPGPRVIHATYVDLSRPDIWIRATKEGENGRTVPSYANLVGAKVAINGDWFSYATYLPVSLAMGDGWGWSSNPVDPEDRAFIACNVTNECWFDGWGTRQPVTPRFWNVVGGSQDRLVIDGAAQHYSGPFYDTDRHPRSGVGLSQDGKQMILVVVEGRSSASIGMTWNEMGDLLHSLGAHQAMMLDGGGSSTMVIDGQVKNVTSDGSPRVVGNHLGIMVGGRQDAGCSGRENGKHCVDATRLGTCRAGALDVGDCGYFGLACEASGNFAYCVDPRCEAGGQGSFCREERTIAGCTDGVLSEGDCGFYGAACITGLGEPRCAYELWQAELDELSFPLESEGVVELEEGQTLEGVLRLRNRGLSAWTPGTTKLSPLPRDEASPLVAAEWLSATRISTPSAEVARGALGEFALSLHGAAPGDYSLSLGLVEEGVTWFGDDPKGGGPADGELVLQVRVLPRSVPGADGGSRPDAGQERDAGPGLDAGSPPEADAGEVPDGGADPGGLDRRIAESAGCGCSAGRADQPGHALAFLGLALGLAGLRRRSPTSGSRRAAG